MSARYLSIFLATLIALCALTLSYTLSVDPFGIYRNNSDDELSRVNQFWYMRNTKPLRLLQADARTVITGTSRSGRLSPISAGLDRGFNTSLPGATPYEQSAMLAMAASLGSTRTVIIGLDFDAFLSFHPRERLGFNPDLVQPVQRPGQYLARLNGLKRMFFSSLALQESYRASHASRDDVGAIYRNDGSWNRPRAKYRSSDFEKLSRDKLDSYTAAGDMSLAMDEFRRMLDTCHEQVQIDCIVLITPVHLFHLGILERAGILQLWREWHRRLVDINREAAQAYRQSPVPIWGFNDFQPAVGQLLSTRSEQADPWFLDIIHFRPRFGNLMLQRMLQLPGAEDGSAGTKLDEQSVADYLDAVSALSREFAIRDAQAIDKLYRNLDLR